MLVHAVVEACHTLPRPLPAQAIKRKTDVEIASRSISHEDFFRPGPREGGRVMSEEQMNKDDIGEA